MSTHVKIAIVLAMVACTSPHLSAQSQLAEDFDYPVGDSLRAHGWNVTGASPSFVNPILVTSPGLTYTGAQGSGVGNAATLTSTGQDVNRALSSAVVSGNVFVFLMVNVVAAQSWDYFLHFIQGSSSSTAFAPRLFIRRATNGMLAWGLSKRLGVPQLSTDSVYATARTYLVVVKYSFKSISSTDDEASLFVFAEPQYPATEPSTPTLGPVMDAQTDLSSIDLLGLRQGSAAGGLTVRVDGIRVTQSWDPPLAVTLGSFTGRRAGDGSVILEWTTLSEFNNYGFEVEKSVERAGGYIGISGLIAGQGTSTIPHAYSFVDNSGNAGRFYRLRQIDLDRSVHLTEPIEVGTTGVQEHHWTGFGLGQNSPNPFNLSTVIRYQLGSSGRTTLFVYDIVGNTVATLVDDVQGPGRFAVRWNAEGMASGMYLYRLTSGNRTALNKMILVK